MFGTDRPVSGCVVLQGGSLVTDRPPLRVLP